MAYFGAPFCFGWFVGCGMGDQRWLSRTSGRSWRSRNRLRLVRLASGADQTAPEGHYIQPQSRREPPPLQPY